MVIVGMAMYIHIQDFFFVLLFVRDTLRACDLLPAKDAP